MGASTHNDAERLPASSGSVMRWTRNTIFKARCVIAEMRQARQWVARIRSNDAISHKEDRECRKTMKRIMMRGHWWKLRSLAKELPLALVLDTPGLRTLWRAWKRRKNFYRNTATPDPDDERAHGMAATVLEGTARKGDARKCAETISKSALPGDSRKDGINSQNVRVSDPAKRRVI